MKLHDKLRPTNFDEIIGQQHLLEDTTLINNLIKTESSVILYGPPGVGKTTFAKIYAKALNANFHELSSIFTTTAQIKEIFAQAKEKANSLLAEKTVLFVDEIHRFNKNQQDLFLPVIEDGTIILIACTTENPSFSLNNALLSRCQTLQFKELKNEDLLNLLKNIEQSEGSLNLTEEQQELILNNSNNDARIFISNLEKLYALDKNSITTDKILRVLQTTPFKADKNGDTHYAYFSAFQKSLRASDDAAAMLYFCKMVENGEDVLSIARRMLVIASEDVGLADPQALVQVNMAVLAYERMGSPEGLIPMAQAVNYLALAPKSNASYKSLKMALALVKEKRDIFPPKTLLNPVTKLQAQQGHGEGYIYDHGTENGFAGQDFFPDNLPRVQLYQPKQIGFERDLSKRLEYFNNIRNKNSKNK